MSERRGSRMRYAARAATIAACLVGAACGPAATPQPTGPEPIPGDELAKRVQAAYDGWSREDVESQDCSVYFAACTEQFARRIGLDPEAGALVNPRAFMPESPDPTWLPGWQSLPQDDGRAHVTIAALTYAASMRTFFATCTADADREIGRRDLVAQRLKAELEAARALPNAYARLGRIVSARTDLLKASTDPVGPRYDVEVALFDAFKADQRELVYQLRQLRVEDAGALRPALSPEEERDLFCIQRGVPSWQDPESIPADYVKIPLDEAKKGALEAKVEASRDLLKRLPAREVKLPELAVDPPTSDGTLLAFGKEVTKLSMVVRAVTPDPKNDQALVVELFGTVDEKDVPYDCKESKKIDRVVPGSGAVEYQQECKKRNQTRAVTLTLRLSQRPDVPLDPGAQITFLGKLKKLEAKPPQKLPGKAGTKLEWTVEVDGTHVLEIWRERLLVADYFSG